MQVACETRLDQVCADRDSGMRLGCGKRYCIQLSMREELVGNHEPGMCPRALERFKAQGSNRRRRVLNAPTKARDS